MSHQPIAACTASCSPLNVVEVGTSTWRQITGSVSRSSILTVQISLGLSDGDLGAAGLICSAYDHMARGSIGEEFGTDTRPGLHLSRDPVALRPPTSRRRRGEWPRKRIARHP